MIGRPCRCHRYKPSGRRRTADTLGRLDFLVLDETGYDDVNGRRIPGIERFADLVNLEQLNR